MPSLQEQLLELGLPSALAATFAEVIPTLTGNRESAYLARKLIHVLNIYARAWEELTADEVRKMDLAPHKGLVAIAREQPWKLYKAVQDYVECRLDEEAQDLYMDGLLDDVVERLVNDAMELADETNSEDIDAN